jgi:hypothetical protein
MFTKFTLIATTLILFAVAPRTLAQCTVGNLKSVSEFEKTALVIDVRPDQINQFRGKSSFKDDAHIVLVNMNPFLFSYTLKVDQTEIQDTGFLNFLKLLGSPVSDIIDSASAAGRSEALTTTLGGNLDLLITRTFNRPVAPHSSCNAAQVADATLAIQELASVRKKVLDDLLGLPGAPGVPATPGLKAEVANRNGQYVNARARFSLQKDVIFDSSVEATQLCTSANTLHQDLTSAAAAYPDVATMGKLLTAVRDFKSLVEELKSSATEYQVEYAGCPARANGLGYAENLIRLANELNKIAEAYETKVNALTAETKGYDALVKTIATLNTHEDRTLQREYTVHSQYDISALDITATAVPLGEDAGLPRDFTPQRVVGNIQSAQSSRAAQGNARLVNVGATDSAQGVRVFAPRGMGVTAQAEKADEGGGEKGGGEEESGGGAKQIKAKGTIGARRFEISAGMAFSGLDRQEFKPVLGYPRNAQGEFIDPATGNTTTTPKLTTIAGLSEQSSRRFAPMALLHYRVPFNRNVFLSAGFTGKNDDYGLNLEYLLGPSVLYKNMFFTFGGYAGKQQKLAGDLYQGAPVEGDFAVRKDYRWSWGFSFTYRIPLGGSKSK